MEEYVITPEGNIIPLEPVLVSYHESDGSIHCCWVNKWQLKGKKIGDDVELTLNGRPVRLLQGDLDHIDISIGAMCVSMTPDWVPHSDDRK